MVGGRSARSSQRPSTGGAPHSRPSEPGRWSRVEPDPPKVPVCPLGGRHRGVPTCSTLTPPVVSTRLGGERRTGHGRRCTVPSHRRQVQALGSALKQVRQPRRRCDRQPAKIPAMALCAVARAMVWWQDTKWSLFSTTSLTRLLRDFCRVRVIGWLQRQNTSDPQGDEGVFLVVPDGGITHVGRPGGELLL
jgi:hypothetical protein